MSSLLNAIRDAASRNPAAPAFIHHDHVVTYRDWFTLVCGMARLFHERGVRAGETVGVALGQSPYHCATLIALARLGAVTVPVFPGTSPAARRVLAERYGIGRVVLRRPELAIEGVPSIDLRQVAGLPSQAGLDFIDYRPDDDTPCRISLSSGTTGAPKGVLQTHGDILDRIDKTLLDVDAGTRMPVGLLQVTLMFFFAAGLLTRGATVIFPRGRTLPEQIAALNLHGATHYVLSPATALQMIPHLPPEGIAFPTLRNLRVVGSAPSPKLLEVLRTRFTPHVYLPYGLSELGPVSLATPEMLVRSPEGTGTIQPWARVEVVDEQDRVLPAGQSGRLRVRMDRMPKEYHCNEEQTREKFRDGWFYPGDVGRVSPEGELFIEGRADDIINIGGHKIFPEQIENVLMGFPGIREAAVFPMQDDLRTTVVAAAVVPERDGAVPDLGAQLRQQLGLLAPAQMFPVKELPRNAMGKIIRSQLHDLVRSPQPAAGPAPAADTPYSAAQ